MAGQELTGSSMAGMELTGSSMAGMELTGSSIAGMDLTGSSKRAGSDDEHEWATTLCRANRAAAEPTGSNKSAGDLRRLNRVVRAGSRSHGNLECG